MSQNYEDLMETGLTVPSEPTPPEKEKFKAVYVTGQVRTNQAGVQEELGKLQIRGLSYNHDKVYMIITHVKTCLVNEERQNNQVKTVCFCYKKPNEEWYGTSGKKCGKNRADREQDQFCKNCRDHLIVAGVACYEDGTPIVTQDEETGENKPNFIFLRGKGMKYRPVNDYLTELAQEEIDPPILEQNTDKDKQVEKQVVNKMRYVTEITVGAENTNYGSTRVFRLNKGQKLNENTVKKVLEMAKASKEDFDDKMDWSKRWNNRDSGQAFGFNPEEKQGPSADQQFDTDDLKFPGSNQEQSSNESNDQAVSTPSFEDISF